MSNGLGPDQNRHSVCPGLGATRLQRLSADEKFTASMEKLILKHFRRHGFERSFEEIP